MIQLSKDQKKQKLKEVKKFEKGKTLLQNVQEKAKLSDKEIEKLEDSIYSKFDSVYDAFIEIGRNGIDSVKELKIPKKTASVIEEICSKIKLPSVEIRGIMEITNSKSDGIEIIKKILYFFDSFLIVSKFFLLKIVYITKEIIIIM